MTISVADFYVEDFIRESPQWVEQYKDSHPTWYNHQIPKLKHKKERFAEILGSIVKLIQQHDVVFAISTNEQDQVFTTIVYSNAELKAFLRKKFKPAYNNNYPEDGPKLHLWVFSKHELKGEICE